MEKAAKGEKEQIMALIGTQYSYGYNHKRKEVVLKIQIGTMAPIDIVISAEAFFQDIDFIAKDKKLVHFLAEVRRRKDLPTNHNFGDEAEIKFDPDEWGKKMEE